ncbi:alpha-sarcoglycan isoform X2 [Diachasma alloeum]|uniref:alpha-sarcoglycan isoform X2 n=1 Tax=Diachasma alloeum TaxID=454923 RepID=UPI0007383955|nr:alpha-sarcoglycan isoform X2 [Diachasma alloeum]
MKMLMWLIVGIFLRLKAALGENILTSRVFVIPVGPELFGVKDDSSQGLEFSYQASLLNSPDLPPWIHYTYSDKHRQGFLYGVAPKNQASFTLQIVGLSKKTYNTNYKVLEMNVQQNENSTKYEVYLKIDNLRIEDTFNTTTMEGLLDLFRRKLWVEARDLCITFLASAVEEGARLPLDPNEPEGVVLKLGSSAPFSEVLMKLEEEVKPLKKKFPCPKDYKRTSKEVSFRKAHFHLDWCSFKLITENQSQHQESARRGSSMNVIGRQPPEHAEWQWARPKKSEIPTRSYLKEIVTTVFIPTLLLFILALLLSTTFCLHHEKADLSDNSMRDKREPTPMEGVGNNGVQMVQYAASERETLRSLSAQPSSPSNSLLRSPRTSAERGNPYVRPNPPPYTGPSNLGTLRVDF